MTSATERSSRCHAGFDVAELCAPSRAIPTEINFEWKYALRIDSTLLYIAKPRYPHNPKLRRHLIFILWLHFTAECRQPEILDQSSLWRCIKVNDRFGDAAHLRRMAGIHLAVHVCRFCGCTAHGLSVITFYKQNMYSWRENTRFLWSSQSRRHWSTV